MNTQARGTNVLVEKKPRSDLVLALKQVQSPLIYVLFIASLVTFYLRDYIDTGVILLAVFINTILGFIQERKAQQSLAALKRMLTPTAQIIKDGKIQTIDARDIIPGDIVQVHTGDRIPADGIIKEAVTLHINEAMLTGESMPVEKTVSDEPNVFAGTVVASGRGIFLVTAIGMETKLGQIAGTLETTPEEETPLQRQIAILAQTLAVLVAVICVFIFLIGTMRGLNFGTMFALAVAIAVAAIPEGMMVTFTVILSVGMERILKRRALVRRLVSAETLGSVSTLCIDKTGTLTEGIMRVAEEKISDRELAVKTAVYANNMENPIDVALWAWVEGQNHYDPQDMNEKLPRISEVPFDATKKYMVVENAEGVWMKGAPEIVLEKCKKSGDEKESWIKTINTYAEKGLRVIGLAWKKKDTWKFIGVLGVSDPVRQGVAEALEACRKAGITLKVVTGDYRVTAEVVLRQIGIPINDTSKEIMEGKELSEISVEELSTRIKTIKLFYRVTPDQKLKIVDSLQRIGEVVAMTGDGVNDALAIKKADIGIVLANASDVAKEEADVVLLDFNFKTILAAIEEGRILFNNIKKVVLYLLSDAFTEMLLITGSIIASVPLPLTAIQILWINILSDGFPDLALAFEPKEYDVMRHPPRPKGSPIIDTHIKTMAATLSITKALIAFGAFIYFLRSPADGIYARTMTFAIVGAGSLIYVFSTRNLSRFIWKDRITKNPFLLAAVAIGFILLLLVIYHPGMRAVFDTRPLAIADWGIIIGSGLTLLTISEITKLILSRRTIKS